MLTHASAYPTPHGGAVQLQLSGANLTHALILATATPDTPDPITRDNSRLIHTGALRHPVKPWHITLETPGINHWQVLDLDTKHLPDQVTVYYHTFEITDAGYGTPITVQATPRCLMTTVVPLLRDLLRPRIEYHIKRGLTDQTIHSTAGTIELLEQETLEEGYNIPVILIKESCTPAPQHDTVGKGRMGEWVDSLTGEATREYQEHYNCRADILILTDSPDDRANLGKYLHGVLQQDLKYFQAAGIQDPEIQRFDRHDKDPQTGRNLWYSEITFSATLHVTTTEELLYKVTDNQSHAHS